MAEGINMRQLIGGLLLIFIFLIVFGILIMMKLNTSTSYSITETDPSYFFVTLLFGITIATIIYMLKLSELIRLKNKLKRESDNFNISNCPPDYEKKSSDKGLTIKCESNDQTNPIPSFYLNGTPDYCSVDKYEENGCFNKSLNKANKCNRLRDYFKTHEEMLAGWTDFRDNCSL